VTAIDKADRLTNLISMKSARQLLLWCLLLTALAAISTYWAVVNEPMRGEGFEIRDLPTRSAAPQVMAKSANGSAVTVNAEVTTNPTHPTVTRQGPMDGEGSSLRKSGTAQPNNNGTPRQYNNGVARQNYINPGPVVAWDKAAGGNGHYYQAVETSADVTWATADKWAADHGGYLATIASQAENDFVFKLIDDPKYWTRKGGAWKATPEAPMQYLPTNRGPWLGGVKAADAKTPADGWTWAHDGSAFTFTNWAAQEPNNITNDETRLTYNSRDAAKRESTWNDVPATEGSLGFVVEYDAPPGK
jgi:hypothetical protein